MDLAGPAQVFASSRLQLAIKYVGPSQRLSSAQGLAIAELESLPETIASGSCLVVIGSQHMLEQLGTAPVLQTLQWLKKHAACYQKIAAVCSGALILGQAELLNGVRCTTHHELIDKLEVVAPNAEVVENCLYVDDGLFITSAGITTGVDLSLQLVNSGWGPVVAQNIARDMVVYQRRNGESNTISFWLQHRNHVLAEIHSVQDKIMQHPSRSWRVPLLAAGVCMSERQFRRRFQQATGQSVQDYLQLARLELSRQLLQQTNLAIGEIAERCGFADERGLRRLWRRREGCSPSVYRRSLK